MNEGRPGGRSVLISKAASDAHACWANFFAHKRLLGALKVLVSALLLTSGAAMIPMNWFSFTAISQFSLRQTTATPSETASSALTSPNLDQRNSVANQELVSGLSEFGNRQRTAGDHMRSLEIAPTERRTIVLTNPVSAVNSTTLQDEDGMRVKLSGLQGFERDEVCFNFSDFRFACGLQGRASLTNLTRDRRVSCSVVRDIGRNEVEAMCFSNGANSLNAQQIIAGWAMPAAGQSAEFQDAIELRCASRNDRSKAHVLCSR